jgi:di/tricarboxylate transporter
MMIVTLIGQTLKQIPASLHYGQTLVFAIAIGENLGGMMTPLSSSQNAITIESIATVAQQFGFNINLSFADFFATVLPFSLLYCLFA